MLTAEWEAFKQWLAAPFTTRISPTTLLIMVALFFVILWIVYDNLDIITKGFKTIAEVGEAA